MKSSTGENVPNLMVAPERFQLIRGVNEDCTLVLTNVGFEAIIFRLLTTSPNRYIVRHTKGVIRGNSSMNATIALNRNYRPEEDADLQAKEGEGAKKVVKDDFRIEYTFLGENDVIEPKFGNVPALIKEKKAADPTSVAKKMIRCNLLLDPSAGEEATTTATSAAASAANPPAAGGARPSSRPAEDKAGADAAAAAGLISKQMENNTLEAKNARKEAEKRGEQAMSSPKVKIIMVVVLLLAILLWLLLD